MKRKRIMTQEDAQRLERLAELSKEYAQHMHAMQSGVEYSKDKTDQLPKHLRVGINARASDHAALASLLIKKGVITEVEYYEELVEFARREADVYRKRLSKEYGSPVDLG